MPNHNKIKHCNVNIFVTKYIDVPLWRHDLIAICEVNILMLSFAKKKTYV